MKIKLTILLIALLAGSVWAMPPAADVSEYFGDPEDPVTYIGMAVYDDANGFMMDGGVTVPTGSIFGLDVYTIPSIRAGDENVEGDIDLAFCKAIGKGWYLGGIITPFGLDWATDIPNDDIDIINYAKCGAGGLLGYSFTDYVGIGIGAKYKRAFTENTLYANTGWQAGIYLTISL
jgi:hypothetical protein